MLKNNFYHITALTHQDNTITAALALNSEHPIFAGHFPGQPVVPGACMLQIVKEVLSDTLSMGCQLKKANNLKFIAPVDPRLTDELELRLTYKIVDAGLQINAALSANRVVCFKMQDIYLDLTIMSFRRTL